jgi:predicted dithiol-disulfide oxidoreductase (DUF899 family)
MATLEAYRKGMGWRVRWVSSFQNDFNRDDHVSFTPQELEAGQAYYNYTTGSFPAPGSTGHQHLLQGRG